MSPKDRDLLNVYYNPKTKARFTSLDSVYDHYREYFNSTSRNKPDQDVYDYMIVNRSDLVESIVKEINTPSIHDLRIIATINGLTSMTTEDVMGKIWFKSCNTILKIYRDRK